MSRGPAAPRRGREILLAGLLFAAVTVVMTWPQAAHMDDALTDFGDAKLVARILHWDFRQTLRDPRDLFQLDFFHPARFVLAFSENFFGVALFGFPILGAGASPLLNYNLLLLLGMFLSALSAWALARHLTGDPIASAVAGMIYAFLPWRMEQLPHLQHQWGAFLCLILLFLLRYLEEGRWRDLVLFAIAFAWNALSNVYFAIFSGFLVGVTLLWFWLRAPEQRGARIRRALAATAAGCVPFLPLAAGYLAAQRLYGMKRYMGELLAFSGRWTDFLSAGEKNRLWGPLTRRWSAPEGHFFPGVVAAVLALVAVAILWKRRARGGIPEQPLAPSAARRALARVEDAVIVALAVLWLAAQLRPGLTIGPLRLGDPGRILVFVALAVVLRLSAAFPGGRYRDLGSLLRSRGLDPRAALLLGIAMMGIVVAMGANTPFYRFLFQSFGPIFRAIRASSRGIVLFDLALAVLAAWGLSLLTRRQSAAARLAATGAALAVLCVEYRAFPLELIPTPADPPAVYRWMRTAPFPGAAVEWPLGFLYDFDYIFRQAAHEKPLVNGYSGFFPGPYRKLEAVLKRRPIPAEAWPRMEALGASLLVYHAHEGRGFRAVDYAHAVRRGGAEGSIELLGSFPHEGLGLDFAYRLTGSPAWTAELGPGGTPPPEAARLFESAAQRLEASHHRLAPPFGFIHAPAEGQRVEPGFWAHGWALDDSGIVSVRVSTELGEAGLAQIGGTWPRLSDVYPDYTAPGNGAYGFPLPEVPPGRHTLRVTLVGRDGGETVLKRAVIVLPPAPSPTPRGPGS